MKPALRRASVALPISAVAAVAWPGVSLGAQEVAPAPDEQLLTPAEQVAAYEAAASPLENNLLDEQLERLPGGVRISPTDLSYNGGNVVYSVSSVEAAGSLDDCPTSTTQDWTCVWEHADFGGRRLQFKDSGYMQYFADYDFKDQTSSWANRRGKDARLYSRVTDPDWTICMDSRTATSSMGGFNDQADQIFLYTGDSVC